ncbi:murein hydrolase activator EnvC family protein [Cytobacillus horneckiae]|uniref:murein hydrolase activator EnvC family protein n=1 Tax=Cytobacillus horneckiae TaxID=549687 RepID=UPI003D227FA0
MKKKIASMSLAAMMGVGAIAATLPTNVMADKLDDLNNQSENLKKEQSGIDSKLNKADSEIQRLQDEQKTVESEIKRLDTEIKDAETKITEKNNEIKAKNEEIERLKKEIEILIDRIEKRNELLKDRARSMQESGGVVSYMDVLLGAQSFSDFIGRVGAVATIVEADQVILKEHQADKDKLEETQAKVKEELASLEKMRNELEQMKSKLSDQKKQQDNLKSILKKEEDHKHAEKVSMEEEKEILAAQDKAIQQAIKNEKDRQAEIARKAEEARQAEIARQEEAKKQEAAKAATNNNSNSGSSNSGGSSNKGNSGGGQQVSAPPVSSGHWTKPAAAGILTSGLGQRWGSFHAGVDIAAGGTVPIFAAADGVVINSYYSSSYGEVVFIAHSIDGQTYTTVYAHMRNGSRQVSNGQTVSKGQQIGLMGNTGDSKGQHLHFELHRGGWNNAKSNAINPVGIVPL